MIRHEKLMKRLFTVSMALPYAAFMISLLNEMYMVVNRNDISIDTRGYDFDDPEGLIRSHSLLIGWLALGVLFILGMNVGEKNVLLRIHTGVTCICLVAGIVRVCAQGGL